MKSRVKHLRFEIPEVKAGHIIDFGPVIDPPFVDGITREAPDSAISLTDVEYQVLAEMPEAEVASRALKTAQADSRVVSALGHRWQFIGVGILDNKHTNQPYLRVVWYTYDTDQTVEAITDDSGTHVHEVRVEFSQPALTNGEEARANEIVAASGRLVNAKDGRGLLVEETDRGSPRYGHRLVDLCFNPDGTRLPRWWALVDLSTGELVDVGDVPPDGEPGRLSGVAQ